MGMEGNTMPTRRALLALPLAAPAFAQTPWPGERAIEVVIPYPPGGGVDAMTRFGLFHAGLQLPGARFVFVNRAGASGQLGLEAIYNAAPDGYTLGGMGSLNISTLPLERTVRWRAENFSFIANVTDDPCALWVLAASPLRSLADLAAALRGRPESLSVGSAAGVGSDDHLVLLALEEATGIRALHAPYNGTAQVQRDLLSGAVDVASFNAGEGVALLREGRLRCLGMAAPARWALLPEVATFREQGFDVVLGSARGIVGPPGLPAPILHTLREAFTAAFETPRFTLEAERVALPLRPLVGEAYRAMVLAEADQVRALHARRPWSR
jgi:tripartite-type tricarboxylate transporter receptor subunit TctC